MTIFALRRPSHLPAMAGMVLALAMAVVAHAQEYPARPIRVIVPFSPGGAVDGPMRMVAQGLGKRLGQSVVVENKPGAGATIGTEIVAKAPPDGYTLLLASQTNAISATLYAKLAFDPIEDFTPITLIGREPGVVVVNPAVPATTLAQFIAYVKERPGQVDFASSGNGSGQHLFAALLASKTGMKMNHIPYKGSSQAHIDIIGGQVEMMLDSISSAMSQIKAGKFRPLAVSNDKRLTELPDVPTLAEEGVQGANVATWYGLLTTAGVPAEVTKRLSEALATAHKHPDVKARIGGLGGSTEPMTVEEFAAFNQREYERYGALIKAANIKAE